MFLPRIIPCLLLKEEKLVKTIQFEKPLYLGDPMNAIRIYNDLEADELVILDIDASKKDKKPDILFIKKISEEAFMPFGYGGNIKTIKEIRSILSSGAEKVVICSEAVANPNFIKDASEVFGSQSIIVCIDVKKLGEKYSVFIKSGTQNTGLEPVKFAEKMESIGAGELIINSIDNDGKMEGYDIELIKRITDKVNVPVIALGGAGELEDLYKATKIGIASGAAAGSLFVFSGKNRGILINYPSKEELKELFMNDKFK
jgi:cyclase